MELDVLLMADYANVAEGGKLNVMGIFSRVMSGAFPARHPEMVLIMQFSANPAEYNTTKKLTVRCLDEDGHKEIITWSRDIPIPEGQGRNITLNQMLKLHDVVFPKAGTYRFYVLVNEDAKGDIPLEVIQS